MRTATDRFEGFRPYEQGFKMIEVNLIDSPRSFKGWVRYIWGMDIWVDNVPVLKVWLLINVAVLVAALV